MKIREALRLRSQGLNNSQIAMCATVNCARSTVVELFKRCAKAGINHENSQNLSDRELEALLYPRKHLARNPKQELNEAYWVKRVAESGKDILTIWEEEYLPQDLHGLSYGQFSYRLKQWREEHSPELDYPKQRKAGEVMETDWCGDQPNILYDKGSRTFSKAHLFVATIGFSQKLFVRAYRDEKQRAWLDAHTRALEYYGGVPKSVKPDNTKTAILKPDRYEAEKNPAFASWAAHYGVAVLPARSGKPKDKDRVEDAVGWVEQKILPKLKEQVFFDLEELNRILLVELKKLNEKPYQNRPCNRSEIFREVDLPAMRPLPAHAFENPEMKWVRASKNGYHVQFDGHRYSVPFQLAGERILLSASSTAVELLYDNKRVALHRRCYARNQLYVTDPKHMPPKHQAQRQTDCMTGDKYLKWAAEIGPHTEKVIATLLSRYVIEEQVYDSCMGILRFSKTYSPFQLELACQKACKLGVGGYRQIKHFLEQPKPETTEERATNLHSNIRGASYYKGR